MDCVFSGTCSGIHEAKKKIPESLEWYHKPLVPALLRQRQVDLYASGASLVYMASSRPVRAMYWDPFSKNLKKNQIPRALVVASSMSFFLPVSLCVFYVLCSGFLAALGRGKGRNLPSSHSSNRSLLLVNWTLESGFIFLISTNTMFSFFFVLIFDRLSLCSPG